MSAVVSPVAGTRTEPQDSYSFIRGTTATFKMIFTSDGVPITVDTATVPVAKILEPLFASKSGSPTPTVLAELTGSLVAGQLFEYEFTWDIPASQFPLDEYIISYEGTVGGVPVNFGDEFFRVSATPGQIGIKAPAYATVDDVRGHKFNIDSYLPESANTLTLRNNLIEKHLRVATNRLREELNLAKSRANSENYRLFCIYYTVWSILLSARGEDGSSVSSQNLADWKAEWARILAQEKRESRAQAITFGRG